jgi:ABC-type multidrug transport system fused ATPase/permease subunit
MSGGEKKARRQVLVRHRDRLEREIINMQELDRRYFWIRLGVLLAGGLGFFIAYQSRQSIWLLVAGLVFLTIFSLVVYFNRKVKRSILRFSLSSNYYFSQLARMELDWDNIPVAPVRFPGEGHPFAGDLDLTGRYSLHQLLNTAISKGGSYRLEEWLLKEVPEPEQVLARQAAVQELRTLPGFRSRLALTSSLVSSVEDEAWDGEDLLSWLDQNIEKVSLRPLLVILSMLAAANIILFILFTLNLVPALWIISLAIYAGIYLYTYRNRDEVFGQAQHLSSTLDRFRAVLVFLERYTYRKDSHLYQLCHPFWQADRKPSSYLRQISTIASASSISANPVVWLLVNVFVPWDVFFAYRLQRYKEKMKDLLPEWLDVWYELEALNSLANFSYLNPEYTFPSLLEDDSSVGKIFESQGIGHPLIPDGEKVCNNFNLETQGEVVIITGSNMSGKSTFLRTIGVNLCLAFAGAAVNADQVATRFFRLFSVIQVTDSLTDGISYFYAEVRRLKALLDAMEMDHNLQVFFLIDEIFRGTNNRERQIGSRAFVNSLVRSQGVGIISTHDLELVVIADELQNVVNYHFQEEVTQGRMNFDYLLRPGPSRTTNALEIMRMEGLPVDKPSSGSS